MLGRLFWCLFFGVLYPHFSLFAQPAENATDLATGIFFYEKSEAFLNENIDSFGHYKQVALPYFERAQAWEDYVNCFNGLANFHYLKGDYQQFENLALRAKAEAEKHLDGRSEAYGFALGNLGALYRQKGDHAKAIELYQEGLKIQLAAQRDKTSIATSYHNISVALRKNGDFDEAISFLNKAYQLRLDSLGAQHSETARTLLDLGYVYRAKEDWDRALNYYHRFRIIEAPKIAASTTRSKRSLINCYQSIAQIFLDRGQRDSCKYYIDRVLQLQKDSQAKRKIQSQELLGKWYQQNGAQEKALAAFQQANTLAFDAYQKYDQHLSKARTFKNLGNTHLHYQNPTEALDYFQQALLVLAFDFTATAVEENPLAQNMISQQEGFEIMVGKAQAFFERYQKEKHLPDLRQAFHQFQYAADLIQDLRQSFLQEGSKLLLAEKALAVYEGGIETALALYQLLGEEHFLEEAFDFAERNKAMLLLESLQAADAINQAGIPDTALMREHQLRVDIAFYTKKINRQKQRKAKGAKDKIANWEGILFDLQQEYQQVLTQFETTYPAYHNIKYRTQTASIADLRQHILEERTALLEYFIGLEKSFLFVLTSDQLQVFELPAEAAINRPIQKLRQIISQAPQAQNFVEDCREFVQSNWVLSEQILLPALRELPSSIERLLMITDDALAYLPFELLFHQKPPEQVEDFDLASLPYLLQQYSLSYNYSATLLLQQLDQKQKQQPKKYRGTFIGYAPSFGENFAQSSSRACTGEQLYSLHCNQQEVEGILELLDGDARLAKKAHKQSFLEEAAAYRIIHLATHACAGEQDWANNKIHFTDDFMSNKDLHNMNLQADLAVLSACNTGSGQLLKGEGVGSLSRAFLQAGCPSTLMSLWSVDDCSTSQLMLQFYQNLLAGQSKDEALRQAKLQHLQAADRALAHPYYWAAFVQSGNAQAMDFSGDFTRYWWLVFLVGMILLFFFFQKK